MPSTGVQYSNRACGDIITTKIQPVFQQLNTRMPIFIQFHLINSQNELSSTLSHKIKDSIIQGIMLKT